MDAIDGMRVFIRALLGFGIKPDEVKVMFERQSSQIDVVGRGPVKR
jgi:cyanophycinase-like exopeptidase